MSSLKEALRKHYFELLEKGRKQVGPDGDTVYVSPSGKELEQIMKFLADDERERSQSPEATTAARIDELRAQLINNPITPPRTFGKGDPA